MNERTYILLAEPSAGEWVAFFLMVAVVIAVTGFAKVGRSFIGLSPQAVRRAVDITIGVVVSFAPVYCSSGLPLILFAAAIVIVGHTLLAKEAHGASLSAYALSIVVVTVLIWEHEPAVLSLSILVFAFGHTAANIVADTHKAQHIIVREGEPKSAESLLTLFLVSTATLVMGLARFGEEAGLKTPEVLVIALAVAIVATAWSALSSGRYAYLTIPLAVAFMLWFYIAASGYLVRQFTVGIGFAIVFAAISYQFRFLTVGGALATFVLASLIFGIGGWKWAVPIITFFILSSVLSRVGSQQKEVLASVFEKSSTRDQSQVWANGGVAGILVALSFLSPSPDYYWMYLGALAAVTADTWGTELGILSRKDPVFVTSFQPVARGTSGGVSVRGILAGLVGAAAIAVSAIQWVGDWLVLPMVIVAGILGSIADSVLGATVQAQYRCDVCTTTTERPTHCNMPATLIRGSRWLNNNAVNWMCGIVGAAVVWIALQFMEIR